jgi:hypothetical protein
MAQKNRVESLVRFMSDFERTLNEVITKRGFFWQTADIYGGISGFYDYGHLGTQIKRNWEDSWLKYFLALGDNYYLIESADILPEEVLKAQDMLIISPMFLLNVRNVKKPLEEII